MKTILGIGIFHFNSNITQLQAHEQYSRMVEDESILMRTLVTLNQVEDAMSESIDFQKIRTAESVDAITAKLETGAMSLVRLLRQLSVACVLPDDTFEQIRTHVLELQSDIQATLPLYEDLEIEILHDSDMAATITAAMQITLPGIFELRRIITPLIEANKIMIDEYGMRYADLLQDMAQGAALYPAQV